MLDNYGIRTDLALEATERFTEENVEVRGVEIHEDYNEEKDIRTTVVKITTENGARTMGRPQGSYITIEAPGLSIHDEDYHREIFTGDLTASERIDRSGKGAVDPCSGTWKCGDHSRCTGTACDREPSYDTASHKGVWDSRDRAGKIHCVSGIVPGVMAQTGMETAEIVQGVVKETKPDMILVIDALAARSSKRLNRTIQISDAGIHPGAGVGNHRSVITKETMGIPVIAIGVPTVVDAATIVNDTMENFIAALETSENLKGVGVVLQGYNSAEKYELVKELIAPHLNGMFVTPKDIDETIRRISYTVSEALNLLFSGKAGESGKKRRNSIESEMTAYLTFRK